MDPLQAVGQVLDLGLEQRQQQRHRVRHQVRLPPRPQPHQPEHGKAVLVQGEQPLAAQGKGDRGVDGAAFDLLQEQRVDVQAALVLIGAGAGLDLLHLVDVRQILPIHGLHPVALVVVGIGEIDPGRLRELRRIVTVDLFQDPVLEGEGGQHRLFQTRRLKSWARSLRQYTPVTALPAAGTAAPTDRRAICRPWPARKAFTTGVLARL